MDEDCADLAEEELPDSIDEAYVKSELLDLCASLIEDPRCRHLRFTNDPSDPLLSQAVHSLPLAGCRRQLIQEEELRRLNEEAQNNVLAKICVRYLDFRHVWEDPQAANGQSRITPAFRDYAAKYWYRHIKSKSANSTGLLHTINALFRPEIRTGRPGGSITTRVGGIRCWNTGGRSNRNPIFCASLLGLLGTVRYLLEEVRVDINHVDQSDRTSFLAACSKGWIPVVEYLLPPGEKGASANLISNKKAPIQVAANNASF